MNILIENVLQGLTAGLLIGSVYALMCVGLGMIFGVMRVINFAQGEFLMLGMYGTLYAYTWLALGSSARRELTLGSDQENALAYADTRDRSVDAAFERIAGDVCAGLVRCGLHLSGLSRKPCMFDDRLVGMVSNVRLQLGNESSGIPTKSRSPPRCASAPSAT